jgi:hypothetical protein
MAQLRVPIGRFFWRAAPPTPSFASLVSMPYARLCRLVLLTCLLIAGTGPSSWAQTFERKYPLLLNRFPEGYILTQAGDTIPGYIHPRNSFRNQKKIFFLDYHGGRTHYYADRIGGFGYEGKHYESLATPYHFAGAFADSNLFMLRTVSGPASLYRFFTRRPLFTLQRGPAYFDLLITPDGQAHEVSYAFKWERLAKALADHPTLSAAIRSGEYRPEETEAIVERYNRWYREQQGENQALQE